MLLAHFKVALLLIMVEPLTYMYAWVVGQAEPFFGMITLNIFNYRYLCVCKINQATILFYLLLQIDNLRVVDSILLDWIYISDVFNYFHNQFFIVYPFPGIHLEKDMCVPFGHTVARTVCFFEV